MHIMQSRRDFLATLSAAGTAGNLGLRAALADEAPPETTRIRLKRAPSICFAPLYTVEAHLRAEGFTHIEYVTAGLGLPTVEMVERGDLDFDSMFAGTLLYQLDTGVRVTAVGGVDQCSSCSGLPTNSVATPMTTALSSLPARRTSLCLVRIRPW